MNADVMQFTAQALYLVLILSLPPIVVASAVGILLAFVQAVTQLQEQTLAFGIKLIAVIATLFVMGSWIGAELLRFGGSIFNRFYLL